MKYSIITFGCRVNQADSLAIEEELRRAGATEARPASADLVVVNTCSVTATADQGARQTIRRVARENPGARIVVTGCYATRRPDEVSALPNVVRVIPNDDKARLLDLTPVPLAGAEFSSVGTPAPRRDGAGATFGPGASLSGAFALSDAGGPVTTARRFAGGDGACGAAIEPGVAGRTAFTLRVQTGCEEQCAYCGIPATRGPSRSVPPDLVLREIERVAGAGFKEIALTGVHLGSYGRDLPSPCTLVDLMARLGELPVDVTFRISSLEPMDCTAEIVDLVASSGGRFAPHFHLPLQHAADRMLAAMRRPYSAGDYGHLVERVAERLPHAAIGSDMIVGFPGETDEDFDANLRYLPSSPVTHLHVFPYSDRPGTSATDMPDKVAGRVVRDRGFQLRAIGAGLTRRFRASQVGTIRPGLTLEDGTLVVTDNYLKVRIPPGLPRNERVRVRIDDADLHGTIER